jgi:transposase-like protein
MTQKQRRRYDDEFRSSAIVILEGSGYPDKKGALQTVSQNLDVPESTLRGWYSSYRNPPPAKLRDEKKVDFTECIQSELQNIFQQMSKKRPDASYKDLVTGAGILIDKLQILSGGPTEITRTEVDIFYLRALDRVYSDNGNSDTED